jgi:hypothetical protein
MNRKSLGKWIGVCGLLGGGVLLLSQSSCARGQQLVGITIQPSSFTFLSADPALTANFTALGTYIHPAVMKNITSEVTWSSNVPQIVAINEGAASPTGNGCGVVNLSASYDHGTGPDNNLVTGYATVTVDNPLISNCPGGTTAPVLTVVVESTNSTGNSVTSSPSGINCPAQTCGAPFASGTTVTLTATPGTNFVSWGTSCPGAVDNVCQIVVSASVDVTAIFQ